MAASLPVISYVDGGEYYIHSVHKLLKRIFPTAIPRKNVTPHTVAVVYSIWGNKNKKFRGPKLFIHAEPGPLPRAKAQSATAVIMCRYPKSQNEVAGFHFTYFPFYVFSFGERFQNTAHDLIYADSPDIKHNSKEIICKKTKFCAFLYSQPVPFRNRLFDEVSKYKRVDALGKQRNNTGNQIDRRVYVEGKQTYMDIAVQRYEPYKFVICCENSTHKGYITEKICSAMLAGCVPIYYGAPDIVEHFNPHSFINVSDFSSFSHAVSYIEEVDRNDELYCSILFQPWLKQNKLNNYFNDDYLDQFLSKLKSNNNNNNKTILQNKRRGIQQQQRQRRQQQRRQQQQQRQRQRRDRSMGGVRNL